MKIEWVCRNCGSRYDKHYDVCPKCLKEGREITLEPLFIIERFRRFLKEKHRNNPKNTPKKND